MNGVKEGFYEAKARCTQCGLITNYLILRGIEIKDTLCKNCGCRGHLKLFELAYEKNVVV